MGNILAVDSASSALPSYEYTPLPPTEFAAPAAAAEATTPTAPKATPRPTLLPGETMMGPETPVPQSAASQQQQQQTPTTPSSRSRNPSSDGMVGGSAAAALASKTTKLKSSYHYERHPLSHSTTMLVDDDPTPLVPNKSAGTPDVWVVRTIKA